MGRRALKDVDAADRARIARALGWAAFPGLFMGIALAVPLSARWGGWVFVAAPVVLTLVVAVATLAVTEGAGLVFQRWAHPRGQAVAPDYSRAEALRLRGDFDEAVRALEDEVGRHPADPEPCLRLARLLRDDLGKAGDAAAWFRAAREARGVGDTRAAAISRELVEMLRGTDLAGALTELARMADRNAGTPAGDWAEAERAELKAIWMAREDAEHHG